MFRSIALSSKALMMGCETTIGHVESTPALHLRSLIYLHDTAYRDDKSHLSSAVPSQRIVKCYHSLHHEVRQNLPGYTTDKLNSRTWMTTALMTNYSRRQPASHFVRRHIVTSQCFMKGDKIELDRFSLNGVNVRSSLCVRYFHYTSVGSSKSTESQKTPSNTEDKSLKVDRNNSLGIPQRPNNESAEENQEHDSSKSGSQQRTVGEMRETKAGTSHDLNGTSRSKSVPEQNSGTSTSETTTQVDGGVEEAPEKMGLFKRFHHTYKQYGKVLVVVHCATSAVWAGIFYYAAMSGVDVEPTLRWLGVNEKIISFYTMPGVGNAAVAYLFYKIATPVRYPVTIGGTHLAVRYLRKLGYMPPVTQENTIRSLVKEGRTHMKYKYTHYQGQIGDFSTEYRERRKNANKRKKVQK